MKLLVDMTSVIGGGGYEQSKALLEGLGGISNERKMEIVCAVRSGSSLATLAKSLGFRCITVNASTAGRIAFSLFQAKRIIGNEGFDAIYVAFGVGLSAPRHCPQIINVAYPIICYPDSPYWQHVPFVRRIKARLKSYFRAYLIRHRARCVIAEYAIMRDRLIAHVGISSEQIIVIPPITGRMARSLVNAATRVPIQAPRGKAAFRILFVSGADQHKNLWRLPAVVDHLRLQGFGRVTFVMTVTETDFRNSCAINGVHYQPNGNDIVCLEFVGPIFDQELVDQVNSCDVFANISDLESISNNFIEAEASKKPMLIADRDFSLSCVRTPYVSCEPHDVNSMAQAIGDCIKGHYTMPEHKDAISIDTTERTQQMVAMLNDLLSR